MGCNRLQTVIVRGSLLTTDKTHMLICCNSRGVLFSGSSCRSRFDWIGNTLSGFIESILPWQLIR